MDDYNVSAVFEAIDNITKPTSLMEKAVDGFGGTLRRVWEFAAGSLVARGIEAVVGGIRSIGQQALEAVGHAQNLEMGLEGLLTENLMYQRVTETQEKAIALTAEEEQKLASLTASRDVYTARLNEMVAKAAEAGGATELQTAQMTQLENTIQQTEAAISALNAKQGQMATTTETSWKNVRDFAEANAMAKGQVQDLLGFVEKLAITSPFETSQVEEVTRIGLAAQMSTDQVKDFTKAFLDYSAVHGITSTNLAFAADQFLQLKKIGKLTTVDLRQLRNLGIDVARVLGTEMGMSVEEFNAQVEKNPALMDDLFNAFIKMAGTGSAGAAQKMASTMGGLMSTLNDIFEVGGKKLLRPVVEAVTPLLSEMLGPVSEFITGGQLEAFGQKVADNVIKIINTGKQAWAAFQAGGVEGLLGVLFPPKTVDRIMMGLNLLSQGIKWATQVWAVVLDKAGLAWDFLVAAFVKVRDWVTANWPTIRDTVVEALKTAWTWVSEKATAIWTIITTVFGQVRTWITENWPVIRDTVIEAVTTAWTWVSEKATAIWAVVSEKFGQVRDWVAEHWPGIRDTVMEAASSIWTWVSEKFGLVRDWVLEHWPAVQEATSTAWGKIQEVFQGVSDFANNTVAPAFNTLKIAVHEFQLRLGAGQEPLEAFKKVLSEWLPPSVSEPIIGFLTNVETIGGRLWDWITNTAIPTLQSWGAAFREGFNPDLEAMNTAWARFKTEIGPAIENLFGGLREVFDALFGSLTPANDETENFFTLLGQIAGFIVENAFIGNLWLITAAVNALGDAFHLLADILSGEWWSNFISNMNLPPWLESLFQSLGDGGQWSDVEGAFNMGKNGTNGSENIVQPRIYNQNTTNVNGYGLGGMLGAAQGQVAP